MRDETIGCYLGQLAARVPAPGGGAVAALHAAQSAALVAMVARYSNGARYDTGAARPPADVIRTARRLIELTEELLPAGNRNVITDVAAAAEAVRAAAVTARLNIEVNLRGVTDSGLKHELAATAEVTDEIVARADQIVAAVRQEIA